MQIDIPIRRITSPDIEPKIVRAQIYNLDDNEYFGLQFNPRNEPAIEFGWSDSDWNGSDLVHVQFLGIGQTEFEITTDFVVDPGAPVIRGNCEPALTYKDSAGNELVKIENIITVIEKWGAIRDDVGRSSLIRVIEGDRVVDGRMTRFSWRADERFASGLIRKAAFRIGFKQWRRPSR